MTTFLPESALAAVPNLEASQEQQLPIPYIVDSRTTIVEGFDRAAMELGMSVTPEELRRHVTELIFDRRRYLEVRDGLGEGALRDLGVADINDRYIVATANYHSPDFVPSFTGNQTAYHWTGPVRQNNTAAYRP